MRIFKQLYKARQGVAALEFALVSVPMLTLVLGTMEFGRLLWTQQALQMTATQGARCMGILSGSCASGGSYSSGNTTSYIETVATTWGVSLTSDNLTLTRNSTNTACAPTGGVPSPPNVSEVTINYTFISAVPGLLTMLSGGKALQGHACFPDDS
jgi:Flp pilus assembly protein TadG